LRPNTRQVSWRMLTLRPILRSYRCYSRDGGNDNLHSGSSLGGLHGVMTTSTTMRATSTGVGGPWTRFGSGLDDGGTCTSMGQCCAQWRGSSAGPGEVPEVRRPRAHGREGPDPCMQRPQPLVRAYASAADPSTSIWRGTHGAMRTRKEWRTQTEPPHTRIAAHGGTERIRHGAQQGGIAAISPCGDYCSQSSITSSTMVRSSADQALASAPSVPICMSSGKRICEENTVF
jgi:hypothetical protein